ncbi:MAG TPA: hypothetical protein PKD90_08480, partial [Phnomibacter sp.]|nr:hypothetical protein [Phnomibacter sp.]
MLQKPVGYTIVCTLMLAITMPACRKKSWDEYYGRPDSLEPPIYQTLEAKGNFKTFLAVIDKSGYKTTLSTAGYWTLFAPHDSAYAVYFRENGISGVEQLDSAACRQLVTYTLAFNGFKKDRIDDYQSNAGWVPNQSFKRRTANYTWVYDGVNTNNQPIKIINSNRNNNGTQFFVDADNNNKYIPIFTDTFFAARALTPGDYTYFYPGRSFSGFHIADATVIEKDIVAENGVVHVINKVITPLPSIDEYLATKPEYSEFKKLLDRFLVEYVPNPTITDRYRVLTGKPDQVFTKVYNAVLAFSPNNENFLKQQDNDGQQNGYTVFIPNNTVLLQYINNVLLEHYPSVEALPRQVLIDFVNAHFWQTTVWPSKFNNTFSFLGEPAKFNPSADVQDKRVLSNGMFYGTSKVQEANVFSSVFGKVYLDPNYSYMLRLMEQELKFVVSNPSQRFTIFMVSNQAWNQAGYFADATVDNNPNFHWRYIPPGGGANVVGSSALVRMIRLINQHVVPNTGADVESLAGQGVFKNYAGEFVRYDNNQVFASGNLDSNYFANVS